MYVRVIAFVGGYPGPIYTMSTTNEGLVTGGKDGYVRMWDPKLQVGTKQHHHQHWRQSLSWSVSS